MGPFSNPEDREWQVEFYSELFGKWMCSGPRRFLLTLDEATSRLALRGVYIDTNTNTEYGFRARNVKTEEVIPGALFCRLD